MVHEPCKEYETALRYIHSIGTDVRIYPGNKTGDLGKMKYLCSLLGDPQECFDVIHIAGSNGKGSATAMLCNIIHKLGYITGRYISPFIERFNERISVNGIDISDGDLALYVDLVREKIKDVPDEFLPNEFEFVTLTAFLYYKNCGCDIVVLETGLGGRLDPTNVIKKPLVSVIMSISLEHTAILGDTLEKIAHEKCGIIKENAATTIYPLNDSDIINLIKTAADKKNNPAVIPDISQLNIIRETLEYTVFEYKSVKYRIKLAGSHQIFNAVTVIETVMNLVSAQKIKAQKEISEGEAVYRGLEETYFPARFEILSREPLIIFDGAHNISGVKTLSENVSKLLKDKKITLLCAMLKDKKHEIALKEILSLPQIHKFFAVPLDSERAVPPEEMRRTAKRYCDNAERTYNLRETLESLTNTARKDDAILCFGSLFLAADIKKSVRDILSQRGNL